jgi:hypothetical protein
MFSRIAALQRVAMSALEYPSTVIPHRLDFTQSLYIFMSLNRNRSYMRMKTHETEETELGFRVACTGSGFMSSTPGAYGVLTSVRVARFSVQDVALHCCVQPRSVLFLLFSKALNDGSVC